MSKAQVRAAILAARRSLTAQTRDDEAARLLDHLSALVSPGTTVCAYVPVGSEPGSPALLEAMADRGVTVLLPVARRSADDTPLPLQWGRYGAGPLLHAPFGLREPAPPLLPPKAVADAAMVIVPALAVDWDGARLGRGAGFYDRTLVLADPAAPRVAVVRDDELVEHLPSEPHDVRMTHALTPSRGLVALRRPARE